EAGGRVRDELLVGQSGVDDLAADPISERDVRANVETEPGVGPFGRLGATRINRINLRAFVDRLQRVMEEDRMPFAGVRSAEGKKIRVLCLAVRGSTTTSSKYVHQTGDTRSVSGSITGIDVVGADHRAHELLRDEVHLVGRAGAGKHAERV